MGDIFTSLGGHAALPRFGGLGPGAADVRHASIKWLLYREETMVFGWFVLLFLLFLLFLLLWKRLTKVPAHFLDWLQSRGQSQLGYAATMSFCGVLCGRIGLTRAEPQEAMDSSGQQTAARQCCSHSFEQLLRSTLA